jgi:hypothetical protein
MYAPPVRRLSAIEVRGFRAFAGWSRLELRPLTLVYGRNNAGKSSILRLLALLADSVTERANSALELGGPAGRGAVFRDLAWRGDATPRTAFRIRLCWPLDGEPECIDELTLDWLDDRSKAIVRALHLRDAKGEVLLAAKALPTPSDESYSLEDDEDATIEIRWSGLLPQAEHPEIRALHERLLSLRQSVIWLDSNRPRPERLVSARGAAPASLDHHGRNALEFMAADRAIEAQVRKWFAEPPIKRALRLSEVSQGYVTPSLRLIGSKAEFHLLDAGEGMIHVLPVLVAAELAARQSGHRVVAVEEPESHLHGDAQRSLARHLARIAASEDPPIILLETHSRMLLLGLQLAVAEGVVPPEQCGVVWCEQNEAGASSLAQIELTRSGQLRGWPRTALADEPEMVRELLDLQDTLERGAEGR